MLRRLNSPIIPLLGPSKGERLLSEARCFNPIAPAVPDNSTKKFKVRAPVRGLVFEAVALLRMSWERSPFKPCRSIRVSTFETRLVLSRWKHECGQGFSDRRLIRIPVRLVVRFFRCGRVIFHWCVWCRVVLPGATLSLSRRFSPFSTRFSSCLRLSSFGRLLIRVSRRGCDACSRGRRRRCSRG